MRILFMGTPDIAAACLEELIASEMEVVGAVSQPDRPNGTKARYTGISAGTAEKR